MLLNLLITTLLSKNFLKIKTLNENTKKDGTLTKISIQPYSQDPKDKDFTIWMFTNENSADAVYGSLGEARWSMECDENGNVLSNGQYKWVRSVGKPIRSEEKKRIKFYGLITDIDDHK